MLLAGVLAMVAVVGAAGAASILALFPYPGLSHFLAFRPLLERLADRGHRLTVLSHFPRRDAPPNYRDISLAGTIPDYNNKADISHFEERPSTLLSNIAQLYGFLEYYEPVLAREEVLALRGEKWDLVLTEAFNTDMFLGLAYLLDAPFVGVSSCALLPWLNPRFGNPDNPSYIPGIFSSFYSPMSFSERLSNTLRIWTTRAAYTLAFEPFSQRVAEKYLGPLPPLSEIAKNTSLLLVNTHHSLHKPRPLSPSVIEVGGIHIPPPRELPQELAKLLNESENGVIYFSMGSLLRGSSLTQKRKEAFLGVFSRLKQTVLWKWEDDILEKPENVHTAKWFPQSDVLGHPNIVLFITHGGLLGLSEAAYFGVPTVCIPMFGDQEMNVKAMVSTGAGVEISYHSLTEENLWESIHIILNNSRYKESAKFLSKNYRDRPMSALDTAVFWTEYVIRHKGAPFLRPVSVELTFYQYYLLDIILLLVLCCMIMIKSLQFFCKICIRKFRAEKIKQS